MNNNQFYEAVINLQKQGKPDTAIDLIYEYVGDICLDELEKRENMDFTEADNIFTHERLNELNFDSKMALLIVSRPFKARLPSRVNYHKSLYETDLSDRSLALTRERFERWLNALV